MELIAPGDFFSSLLMLWSCVLHVLRHFVHWTWRIEAMGFTVLQMQASCYCVLQLRVVNRIVMAA